jgi:hypothetical protein
MKKYQNLVFLPASDELRQDLYKLGLDFLLVRIEGQLQFMIITNQMKKAQELAYKHNINEFYVSDSHRQLFKLTTHQTAYNDDIMLFYSAFYEPNKLGRLSKDLDKTSKPFLVVTEDNTTYHYIVE